MRKVPSISGYAEILLKVALNTITMFYYINRVRNKCGILPLFFYQYPAITNYSRSIMHVAKNSCFDFVAI